MNLLLGFTLASLATASVVILPGGTPKPFVPPTRPVSETDYDSILRNSAPSEFPNSTVQVILSSYSGTLETVAPFSANASDIFPSADSFARGALQAWAEHLHLEIRPEEVWFTILAQLSFYMEANAESVRHLFVNYDGQQPIVVHDKDWTKVLWRFQDEIQSRVQTPWLKDWIVPNFTTTTIDDRMTANILMMGLMKAYFTYEGGVTCGLPSVTLLGEKADWEDVLARLDRLTEFGTDPDAYRSRLTPILTRIVKSFDEPDSDATRKFWSQIVTAAVPGYCGAPPIEVSGWISSFWFWDSEGKPWERGSGSGLTLDNVTYTWHDIRKLPVAYSRAPFVMERFDNMDKFPAYVAAGTLGKRMVSGFPEGYAAALVRAGQDTSLAANASAHGTLRPLSAWMLYGPMYPPGPKPFGSYDDELLLITQETTTCLRE